MKMPYLWQRSGGQTARLPSPVALCMSDGLFPDSREEQKTKALFYACFPENSP
ncbi:hypothetical protein [Sabulibacter ruber]|uniref:hypothetical protein n=1 Tax=Sabulibacter ruber TaxID=2811901 RepID=UPI001A972C39|nr:hypothetical protein [Sabulibacter ruber]